MFRKESDFEALERVMVEVHLRQPIRILSYFVLSNHWHFVAWPEDDGRLTDFFRRPAHKHAIHWRISHRTVGYGHLYQGRFKSFPVQSPTTIRRISRGGFFPLNSNESGKRRRTWPRPSTKAMVVANAAL